MLLDVTPPLPANETADAAAVSSLDVAFQSEVKVNAADAMGAILHQAFVMVLGDGRVVDRDTILAEARSGLVQYEIQDEDPGTQTVRVVGDTAVVTACIHLKGRSGGVPFERRLWFSDVYVRTAEGWRYFFAQVGAPLPITTGAEKPTR